MTNMVTFYEEDYCMDCNTEHSLSIIDIYDNKISMTSIIKEPSILSRRRMSHIKCDNCKREYNIDWSSDSKVPRPLITNLELNYFLQEYKQNNKYILYR